MATVGGLVALYLGAWFVSPLVGDRKTSDLDIFFWPSAQAAIHGHLLQIYSVPSTAAYPDANGPLSLMPLAPAVAIADALRVSNSMVARSALASIAAALIAIGIATLAVHIIRQVRGAVEWRLAAFCVFLIAPTLWFSVGDYGHVEQPLELLFVFAAASFAMRNRWGLAGALLGLSVLTRSTALLCIIPFAVVLLASQRWWPAARLAVSAAATVAIGLAPFAIADGPGLLHSLAGYRGSLPIGGGSFWVVAWHTAWSGVAQHADILFVIGLATAVQVAILRWRPRAADGPAGFFGLLTIASACFPMLAKTAFPYYLLEPYAFAALWWLARPGSALNWRVAVPLLLTADAFISKQASGLPFDGLGLGEGIASSAVLAFVIVLVTVDLLRKRSVSEEESPQQPPVLSPSEHQEPALAR